MQRRQVTIGLLGWVLAASAARAAIPEVTLFAQEYALQENQLAGKYANGSSVTLVPGDHNNGGITFVQGETPEKDRLFVSTAFRDDPALVADQFFLLTGADPTTGAFSQTVSNLTQYFGGARDRDTGGRVANVTFISDEDTGKGKDLNVALNTLTGFDYLRFYDWDTLATATRYTEGVLLQFAHRDFDPDPNGPVDENMPAGGFVLGAPGPQGTVLFVSRGNVSGPQLSLFHPKQRKWLNVLTNVGEATPHYNLALLPSDIEHLSGNEYLLLASTTDDLNANPPRQVIFHMALNFPADLSQPEPGRIEVEVKGFEEILATEADDNGNVTLIKDVLGSKSADGTIAGISSMALGRPVGGANGPRRLYFRTRDGRLITASPVSPAPNAGQ
jgi:hypothetical protein